MTDVSIDMTQPGAHEYFHLAQLKGAIKLEMIGLRSRGGKSAWKYAKDLYGFKGTREQVIEQIEARLAELRAERGAA